MKKIITFEEAALAMIKSAAIEYLETEAFNPDCIDTKNSIFRKKLKLILVKSRLSPTKYGTVESKRSEKLTIGGAYVNLPTPGRKNHYKDVSMTVEVAVDPVGEKELMKEFRDDLSYDDLSAITKSVEAAIESVEREITATCRIEIVKFGNVWSPVSVTANIDGEDVWFDFLSEYDTYGSSLSRKAKVDESKSPEFDPNFGELMSL